MGLNIQNMRSCSLSRAANLATASGVALAITWDTAIFNPNSLWLSGTNPTRVTIDKPGLYNLSAINIFQAAVDNAAYVELKVNGTAIARVTAGVATTLAGVGGGTSVINVSYLFKIGDYVEVFVLQATGAINTKAFFTVSLVHPQQDWSADTEAV